MLNNLKNYGPFAQWVQTGHMTLKVNDINNDNWESYYNGAISIMKDGIETDFVHTAKVDIVFNDGVHCRLTIMDLAFNIIMWYLIVRLNKEITPCHLFFDKAITKATIKKFIDYNFIIPYHRTVDFKKTNNLIDDTLHNFMDIDTFSMYLASTVNLEDFVYMMMKSDEFNSLMHVKLADEHVPIEDIKSRGMEYTNRAINLITEHSKELIGHDHCLADSFRSKEGTKSKQFKEFAVNIGTKPDGKGGAHPIPIDNSYLNGGLNQLSYQFIDSAASRYAQIITKDKVGPSGNFARIVGLNSMDSFLHDDPEYDCHTHNLLQLTITSNKFLKYYRGRWFRYYPDGPEYLCDGKDQSLIGKTLYFRSPETCASAAHGRGICFKCYGELSYTNRDIKVGKMAAELFTNRTTQERLSSKHQLETKIRKFLWNGAFEDFFEMTMNIISLKNDAVPNPELWSLYINPDDIKLENSVDYERSYSEENDSSQQTTQEEDDSNYNEYVEQFYVGHTTENGLELIRIAGDEPYKMYISNSLNKLIRDVGAPVQSQAKCGDEIKETKLIKLKFSDIEDTYLFFTRIENNELGKSLNDIQDLMDKKEVTEQHTYSSLTQSVIEAAIEGDLGIDAIHYEVLISNQIRSVNSNIKMPNWDNPNEPYRILTLKQALTDHPSVTISLLYQNLKKTLYYPLTFKKNKPSFMDLFFMQRPQNFMTDTSNIVHTASNNNKNQKKVVVRRVHK